jgi:hypothetical protein
MSRTDRAMIVATMPSAERVRISRDGTVLAYGRMPNSTSTGWYFAGYADEILRIERAVRDAYSAYPAHVREG